MLHAEKIFQVRAQNNTTELRLVLSEGKEATNSQNDGGRRASREAARAARGWPGRIGEFGNITMEVFDS